MAHYYNEFDGGAAEWIRELIRSGLVPDGEVDERPIQEVQATDLRGFVQCHFFSGILGWVEALRLAGWPADRRVWTGSPPCQSFSSAGKQKGFDDPRDLWPHFFRLIRECRPDSVFGEEVEGAIRHGWLDRVHADVEGEGYAVGHCVLGAHCVGSPHIRQRLFFVLHRQSGVGQADAGRGRVRGDGLDVGAAAGGTGGKVRKQRVRDDAGDGGHSGVGQADARGQRCERRAGVEGGGRDEAERGEAGGDAGDDCGPNGGTVVNATGGGAESAEQRGRLSGSQPASEAVGVAESAVAGPLPGPQSGVSGEEAGGTQQRGRDGRRPAGRGRVGGMADGHGGGGGPQLQGQPRQEPHADGGCEGVDGHERVDDAEGDGREQGGGDGNGDDPSQDCDGSGEPAGAGALRGGMGDTEGERAVSVGGVQQGAEPESGGMSRVVGVAHDARPQGRGVSGRGRAGERPAGAAGGAGFWDACDLILCRDGKWRRIPQGSAEPHLRRLADGLPGGVGGGGVAGGGHGQGSFPLTAEKVEGRVALLRGFGNAIIPAVAAEFVMAFMDATGPQHSG